MMFHFGLIKSKSYSSVPPRLPSSTYKELPLTPKTIKRLTCYLFIPALSSFKRSVLSSLFHSGILDIYNVFGL